MFSYTLLAALLAPLVLSAPAPAPKPHPVAAPAPIPIAAPSPQTTGLLTTSIIGLLTGLIDGVYDAGSLANAPVALISDVAQISTAANAVERKSSSTLII